MRQIFEKNDVVEILEDWRDWVKGEYAKVKESHINNAPQHDAYTLSPLNNSKKDIHTLLSYQIKYAGQLATS